MTSEEIKSAADQLVVRTCREQGLPEKVQDQTTVAKVASMIKSGGGQRAGNGGWPPQTRDSEGRPDDQPAAKMKALWRVLK